METSITLLLIHLLLIFPSTAVGGRRREECYFPAIFNFGDSNSDTGGLSAAFGQAAPPNGMSYFHHPAGRYCDGRLIVDFIAERLGLPHLSAYLDAVGSNFSHGVNFATAGSTIRPPNTTLHQSGFSPFSLDVQFHQFRDFRLRSHLLRLAGGVQAGMMPAEEDFSRALYMFDIGQNDLTAGYFLNMTTDGVRAYVPDVISQFEDIVKDVYNLGGRFFLVHNTGPVGCLAYVLDRLPVAEAQIDMAGCARPFNDVARYFNDMLNTTVSGLRTTLRGAVITYVDIYSIKYALFSKPGLHGFSGDPKVACCGHGGGRYNFDRKAACGAKKVVKGREVVLGKACKDPRKKINWDGVHFTEAANKQVFYMMVNGSFSYPPLPLIHSCWPSSSSHPPPAFF